MCTDIRNQASANHTRDWSVDTMAVSTKISYTVLSKWYPIELQLIFSVVTPTPTYNTSLSDEPRLLWKQSWTKTRDLSPCNIPSSQLVGYVAQWTKPIITKTTIKKSRQDLRKAKPGSVTFSTSSLPMDWFSHKTTAFRIHSQRCEQLIEFCPACENWNTTYELCCI